MRGWVCREPLPLTSWASTFAYLTKKFWVLGALVLVMLSLCCRPSDLLFPQSSVRGVLLPFQTSPNSGLVFWAFWSPVVKARRWFFQADITLGVAMVFQWLKWSAYSRDTQSAHDWSGGWRNHSSKRRKVRKKKKNHHMVLLLSMEHKKW